ncbi:hypothetical protein PPL_00054 [Heterostelium album PN500]|uniref:Uncharacterized protein n=1 Tax=Heterostelium pallidum (strain ATCC 26659 / Pp 5 / PN500) TaxID=670386 RepID=D3BVQ3_HETP5|nr:hypothetical protein PPL_00054 [Heterostelium album PN500]EFA74556.1 hypothetical protein PPL_00054 [Heterostelium album PN500]|eukprot:XP_020426690.1 hypothetical protein PPL_00054 [Heterostelium album PN500]
MKSNYIYYLFVIYLIYNFANVVHSAECGSNAPPLEQYQITAPNGWSLDFAFADYNRLLLDFGGVGQVSKAVAEKIYLNQPRSLHLRFYTNDIYDLYFTVYDFNGVPCNHTASTNATLAIPKVDIIQPKCLFTNATITPINNTIINAQSFTIKNVMMASPDFEMTAYTPTFQYGVLMNGVYSLTYYPSGFTSLLNLQAKNDLVPLVNYPAGILGKNNSMTILNPQSFTSIKLYDPQGVEVAPTSPNTYTIMNTISYNLVAVSNTCGTQVLPVNSDNIPILKSTVHSYNCDDRTVGVSFGFDYNVTGTDYSLTYLGNPYQIGEILKLEQSDSVSIQLNGQFSTRYYFYISPFSSNLTYTVDSYPTCFSDGSIQFNYDGDISNVRLNGQPLLSKTIPFEYDTDYIVQPFCGDSFSIRHNNNPLYSVDSTSRDCLGTSSIVISNYKSFHELNLTDTKLNINYTINSDGVFKDVINSDNLLLSYRNFANCSIFQTTLNDIIITDPDVSTIDLKKQILTPTTSCQDKVSVNFEMVNHGVLIDNVTLNLFMGESYLHKIKFGTCPPLSYYLEVGYSLNATTYKIIRPAVCKDSLALVQFESVDLLNLDSLYVDGNNYGFDRNSVIIQVPTGKHIVELNYWNDMAGCVAVLEIDIPYTKDIEIAYTVTNQDSTNCSFATGSVHFSNIADFFSLEFDAMPLDSSGTLGKLNTGDYLFEFNHTVCGVGQINIPIVTDGKVILEEIYHPTCIKKGQSDGIHRVTVFDRLGNRIRNITTNPRYSFDNMGIIAGLYDEYENRIQYLNCIWPIQGEIPLTDIKITYSDIKPFTSYPGSFNFNVNQPIRINQAGISGFGSPFVYPNHIDFALVPGNQNPFQIMYNDLCVVSTPGPVSPAEPDFGIKITTKCGTLDNYAQFPQSVVDNYYITTNNGVPDENNQIPVYSGLYILLTSKATGQLHFLLMDNSNIEAPSNVQYTLTNESCFGSSDGSITIINPDASLTYRLSGDSTYPQPVNGSWTGLPVGEYQLSVTNTTSLSCNQLYSIIINSNEPVVNPSVVRQCVTGGNGIAAFSTIVNNQQAKNVVYSVDGVESNSEQVLLPSGNYTVKAFVKDSTCRQFVNQDFTIQSNIIEAEVVSSICSTASIKATSELQDQLIIRLINVTNGGNSLVGQAINGNTANITNLSRGTYQFTVAESSGCLMTTTSFNILECPTQPPTETPTQTPVNHSYQLSPSSSLLFTFLTIISMLFIYHN